MGAREWLGWQPQFDDLTTIVTHALAWERKLGALQNRRSTLTFQPLPSIRHFAGGRRHGPVGPDVFTIQSEDVP